MIGVFVPSFAEVSRVILLLAALGALMAVLRARPSYKPMAPEWRTFIMEFIKNNTGIVWAFGVIAVFLFALFRAIDVLRVSQESGQDNHILIEIVVFFLTTLANATGWMGNMLTGTPARTRTTDRAGLPPGVEGTQKTTESRVVETEVVGVAEEKPGSLVENPIVVQKIEEPVTVKPEEGK